MRVATACTCDPLDWFALSIKLLVGLAITVLVFLILDVLTPLAALGGSKSSESAGTDGAPLPLSARSYGVPETLFEFVHERDRN